MHLQSRNGKPLGRYFPELAMPDGRYVVELAAQGTPLEGAELRIDEPAGRLHCRTCQVDQGKDDLILLCECGSADVEVTAGRELALLSVEVV